jgi:hypothetical protein
LPVFADQLPLDSHWATLSQTLVDAAEAGAAAMTVPAATASAAVPPMRPVRRSVVFFFMINVLLFIGT